MAGYITKFVKKEIREEKAKQSRIESSKSEQQMEDQTDTVIAEPAIIEEEAPETVTETASVEEAPETVTETASVEEAPEEKTE
jgi:small subunit ribosomal protein S17e